MEPLGGEHMYVNPALLSSNSMEHKILDGKEWKFDLYKIGLIFIKHNVAHFLGIRWAADFKGQTDQLLQTRPIAPLIQQLQVSNVDSPEFTGTEVFVMVSGAPESGSDAEHHARCKDVAIGLPFEFREELKEHLRDEGLEYYEFYYLEAPTARTGWFFTMENCAISYREHIPSISRKFYRVSVPDGVFFDPKQMFTRETAVSGIIVEDLSDGSLAHQYVSGSSSQPWSNHGMWIPSMQWGL